MRLFCLVLISSLLFLSCEDAPEVLPEVTAIDLDLEVVRFDQIFAQANEANLKEIKAQFPLFFPERYADSIWINRMRDTVQNEINQQVAANFKSFELPEQELELLFKHFSYYFDEFTAPEVYTFTEYVDYKNRVVATPEVLLIALDSYLGSDHYFYQAIPNYVAQGLAPNKIPVDVALAYGKNWVSPPRSQSLLSYMIYQGKLLYLMDLVLPLYDDHTKIGYTAEQLLWAKENEQYIWRYFVEKEILFDTNPKLLTQFIKPAPFSKFYLEIDNESPGRIGAYLGWRMVRAYMENNNTDLRKMLLTSSDQIYNNAKYKPLK